MFPDNWMILGDNNICGSTGAPVQKKLGAWPAVFELAMYMCLGRPFLSMRGISMSYVNLYDNLWAQLQGSGDISSELYGDWLWDENFKFCLIFTHFSRFSPFSGYIWWNNTLSSLENFSLNSILFFLFLMSHPDNGGFLKIAQKRDSISKKTSFCIMVINTDHQESWFLSVGHPLCALR